MARPRDYVLLPDTELSLTLDRYQEVMQIPIAAFNGLNLPTELPVHSCTGIWSQTKRDDLAKYIAKAEELREKHLNYFLSKKQYTERMDYSRVATLSKKQLVTIGRYTTTDIELDYPLVYRDFYGAILDPVVVTFSTDVTSTAEIAIYYPGEDVRITPERIIIADGVCTVLIPRSRLVKPELNDDREDKLMYSSDANFLEKIDLRRRYVSTADGIIIRGLRSTDLIEIDVSSAVGVLKGNRAARVSSIEVFPNTPSIACAIIGNKIMNVTYISGFTSNGMEIDTARLAHTYMPSIPCNCPLVAMYWAEDVKQSKYTSPYGNKEGAIQIYTNDMSLKVGIGGTTF